MVINKNNKPVKKLISACVAAVIAANTAQAGGFSLYTEGSPAAIGNYAAGIAAEAYDASIGWYNPAGLVLLKDQQAVIGGVGVFPNTKLTGTSTYSTPNPLNPAGAPFVYQQTFQGLQGAKDAFVPSFHYAQPLGERAAFGLSIVAPFGLSTEWPSDSPLRYAATLSDLVTINLSPEIAGWMTDWVSFGLGLDIQYAKVKFNSVIGSPALMEALGFPATTLDSSSNNQGDSIGIGFHAGVLAVFNENHTRIGVNYQSQMRHQFSGRSILTGRLADPDLNLFLANDADPNSRLKSINLLSNDIHLPEVITLSAYQDVDDKIALLGSLVYTGWSSFKTIQLKNVAAGVPNQVGDVNPAEVTTTAVEDYRDVLRFALGVNYKVTDKWLMRFGSGFDQTPTVNSERDVRLPDVDRWALSVGSHYQIQPDIGVDVGYTYLLSSGHPVVNKTSPVSTSSVNVNARGQVHAQLFGIQAVWKMDKSALETK